MAFGVAGFKPEVEKIKFNLPNPTWRLESWKMLIKKIYKLFKIKNAQSLCFVPYLSHGKFFF